MTTHFLGGAVAHAGAMRWFPLCHPQLQLYDSDELIMDIGRVYCSQCRRAWFDLLLSAKWHFDQEEAQYESQRPPPPPLDFVCEGQTRIEAELERQRRDAVVTMVLTKTERGEAA